MRADRRERLDEALAVVAAGDGTPAAGPPGAAVAVADAGGLIHAAAAGVSDLATGAPMTTRTRYPIASTTKPMNATLLAMLVEDGVLEWDRPVRADLPAFDLVDPDAGARATLRDLVSLRTGLPRHDWIWGTEMIADRAELVRRFRHLAPVARLRERFLYNNLTATLAGHVAEVATGRSWEELVTERLLGPLGMDDTATDRPAVAVAAYSHPDADGPLAPAILMSGAVTAPAGGAIHSTVEDMARWIAFNLAAGETAGRRLISRDAFAEVRAPQILLGPFGAGSYSPSAAYALGWFVDDFRGRRRISHDGHVNDVDGSVMTLPDEGVGVVTVTSAGCFGLARPLAEHALAVALGIDPGVALRDVVAGYPARRRERTDALTAAPRVVGTSPSHALADHVGEYDHVGYGPTTVRLEAGRLVLGRGALDVPLRHWHYDAWAAEDPGRIGWHAHPFDGIERVVFGTGADGTVDSVDIRFEPLLDPIRFRRTR